MANTFFQKLRYETHVWYNRPESISNESDLNKLKKLLSEKELARYRQFRFVSDSHCFLVSHALVRLALSKYLPISPSEWLFEVTTNGRPEIKNNDIPQLYFNLTHTKGLIACVVSLEQECGIDAEYISERPHLLEIAKKMFSYKEYFKMQQLTGRAQLNFFYTRWTLREAYVKALGIGISFPTHKLLFDCQDKGDIKVKFKQRRNSSQKNWKLNLQWPDSEHAVAIAIRERQQVVKNLVSYNFDFQLRN